MTIKRADMAIAMLQGIATRDAALATRYLDPRTYVEHNVFSAEGIAGLRDYVARLPDNDDRLEVVRVVEDGALVMLHGQGSIGNGNVFFDVFRFEDDLIVEHWNFSAAAAPPNESGHTQTDGPAEPKPGEDAEKNKALVRDYYQTVHLAGRHDAIRRYMADNFQIRHEPGVRDGVDAFEADLATLTVSRTIDEIVLMLGQGDLVFIAAKGTHEGKPCAYVDLYRVENSKLAEHWGFPEEERIAVSV